MDTARSDRAKTVPPLDQPFVGIGFQEASSRLLKEVADLFRSCQPRRILVGAAVRLPYRRAVHRVGVFLRKLRPCGLRMVAVRARSDAGRIGAPSA